MSPVRIEIHSNAEAASSNLAALIAREIRHRAAEGRTLVLGLATGSTPIPLYEELIRLHREEGLSFSNVVTFNLDEYYGLSANDPRSYHDFMRRKLFAHVDLPPRKTHLPGGIIPREQIAEHCAAYEAAIAAAGGIDIQILGIGRTGHIGFNEPPSSSSTATRLVELDPITRQDAAPAFAGIEHVPKEAVTMGVATVLRSRRIFLMAWGKNKAEIVARSLHQSPSPDLPATLLQQHHDVTYLLDEATASQLDPAKR